MGSVPVRLSVSVMTHRRRLRMAERLRDSNPALGMRIAVDTGPPGVAGAVRGARKAWASVDPDATHHLVVQDDVHLPADLDGRLRPVIESRPDGAVSLFVEWGAWTSSVARIAALCDAGWAEVIDDYVPTQAMVLPAELARAAAGYLATVDCSEGDDIVLLRYLRSEGVVPHVCVPNLAEHRDEPSLAGNDGHGLRRSVCWLPEQPPPGTPLARAVTGIDLVPLLAWWDLDTFFHLKDPAVAKGWRKVPAVDLLPKVGLPVAALRELCGQALDEVHDHGLLDDLRDGQLLFRLWLAAFSLGLRAAGTDPVAGFLSLDTPVARRALATLPCGALRNLVPSARLDGVAVLLEPVVRAAVRAGAEVWSSGPARSGISWADLAGRLRATPT